MKFKTVVKQTGQFDEITERRLDAPDYMLYLKASGVKGDEKILWSFEIDYACPDGDKVGVLDVLEAASKLVK